ncbi:MAG: aldehyde dehydrogenase [Amycolatopsis sp.]|uniref:aldehyde dehydrogenase family protein n=1 Tax=Amycolatopsis sp. TaxID=37632 RepID=UPI0026024B98|nr:aldehyde dehydrogenase family protein [Amycolatopsis sp.]MCU1684711.1 aldehyde dehydrogenase [Amycolatopsis sp.]
MTTDTATDAEQVVSRLRATFNSGRTKPISWRRGQLQALRAMLVEQDEVFLKALHTDLNKNATEAERTEVAFITNEIDDTLENLEAWLAPEEKSLPASMLPATGKVVREPLGVSLVVGPWNYPLHLAIAPLVGTIAAGNCAVVKPSELAPSVSTAIAELLPQYLDTDAYAVVEGAIPETTALLEQKFDHIFYTGNGVVGRIVMTAAAKHLTPVALELGGKSPVVVEPGVDLAATAQRIVWGKFMNAGQTCVAPDYILAIGDTAKEIEPYLAATVRALYGDDPAQSPNYGRIIATRHFDRLAGLLDNGRTVVGGETDRDARYIAPTVLADVDPESAIMAAEIFGPILPIISVPDVDAAIAFITARDKPLALYAFTESDETKARLLNETSSGALSFGIPVAHLTASELPFGGVGESGLGRYHGKYSIDTFSHLKGVVDKPIS